MYICVIKTAITNTNLRNIYNELRKHLKPSHPNSIFNYVARDFLYKIIQYFYSMVIM